MPHSSRLRSTAGVVATVVNFPVVFVGLIAITSQTSGDDEIALLNLWAAWGISLGLLGQVGLVSGVLDRRGWTSAHSLRIAGAAGVIGAIVGLALADSLFPTHESWWVAVGIVAASVYVLGRQRADLTLRAEGTIALAVTALENTVRTVAVLAVLIVAFDSPDVRFGATAIVAPFAVSLAVMWRLLTRPAATSAAAARTDRVAGSISIGILAGVPALTAYAIVPGLTLLDTTSDLDGFAIASSLLRGPLLVASFAAPWLLQFLLGDATRRGESLWYVPLVLTAIQFVVGLVVDTSFTAELVVHGAFGAAVASTSYLSILRAADRVDSSRAPLVALAGALIVFTAVLLVATEIDRIHPFLALSAACSSVPLSLRAARRQSIGPIG